MSNHVKMTKALGGVMAAGAAAAGAQQAGAAIVYHAGPVTVNAANPSTNIDFNGDGLAEISIGYNASTGLAATKQNNLPSYMPGTVANTAKALAAGEMIDSTQSFSGMATPATLNNGAGTGEFTQAAGEKYIGIEFAPSGGTRYGWVGFQVTDDSSLANLTGVITGYAYEDSGAGILTGAVPEPSSLALLAMGAAGMAAYRRRARS